MFIGFIEEHTTDFNNKDGQYSYSVTLRRVRVTIVVVEQQKLLIIVYSISSTLSHKRHSFFF